MRRRELAVNIAGAAGMAEIGEIVEVAVGERAAHLHRGKHRAEPLAIAAGVADRHQPVGFLQDCVRMLFVPARFSVSHCRRFPPAIRPNTLPIVMPMPAA